MWYKFYRLTRAGPSSQKAIVADAFHVEWPEPWESPSIPKNGRSQLDLCDVIRRIFGSNMEVVLVVSPVSWNGMLHWWPLHVPRLSHLAFELDYQDRTQDWRLIALQPAIGCLS